MHVRALIVFMLLLLAGGSASAQELVGPDRIFIRFTNLRQDGARRLLRGMPPERKLLVSGAKGLMIEEAQGAACETHSHAAPRVLPPCDALS